MGDYGTNAHVSRLLERKREQDTYVAAYNIRLPITSPLAIDLCLSSVSVNGQVNRALLVPHNNTIWTKPMRRKRGITASITVLSSRKSFSDRIKRPATRRKMIVAQKRVIHQQTRRVGLSSSKVCSGGGDEYNDMVYLVNNGHARQPPQRDERGVRSRPRRLADSVSAVTTAYSPGSPLPVATCSCRKPQVGASSRQGGG